jgi:hypothetical protein
MASEIRCTAGEAAKGANIKMKPIQEIEKEIAAQEAAEKAAREKELNRILTEHQTWKEAQERERKQAEATAERERREKDEAELEERARQRLFASSPAATEADYQRMREQLREQVLLEDAAEQAKREKAAQRRQATLTKSTF